MISRTKSRSTEIADGAVCPQHKPLSYPSTRRSENPPRFRPACYAVFSACVLVCTPGWAQLNTGDTGSTPTSAAAAEPDATEVRTVEISASEAVPDGLGPVSSDAPTAPPTAAQSAPYSEASHDELVRRVRLGTLEPIAAIEQVDVWLAEPLPGAVISRLVSDRLVWLAQAFAPEAALESQSTLSLELLHDYALYVPSLIHI